MLVKSNKNLIFFRKTFEYFHSKDVGNRQHTVECSDQSICVSGYSLGLSSAEVIRDALEWETFSTVKTLSFYIKSLLDKSSNRHHSGFVLIRCTTRDNNKPASQILVLPPRHVSKTPHPHVNINLVMMTNMTRQAMYQNMDQVMAMMTRLNTASSSRTEVLDFSLVQDLGGREVNLAGLLTGQTSLGHPPSLTLTRNISATGHLVTWHSSQCWNTSDLIKFHNLPSSSSDKYQHFLLQLKNSGVSTTGISTALCLNPLPVHETIFLLLSSSRMQVGTMSSEHQSHLSLVSLPSFDDVSENTTDHLLVDYLENVSTVPNTVTILTSLSSPDPTQSLPLFMFIPHKLKSALPENKWQSFVSNQQSLVSMVDLHHTILYLVNATGDQDQTGLMSSQLTSQHCSNLPRTQFQCLCQPSVTSMDQEMMEAVAETLTIFHNSNLAKTSDTVCSRLKLDDVVYGEVSNYGPDDNYLQLEVVFVLVPVEGNENGAVSDDQIVKSIISGSIDLELESKSLKLDTWRHESDAESPKFGCIQQYTSLEDSMKMMIKMIEEERRRAGVRVDSIFTENNIDCLWMVTRKYIGGKISSLSLVSVCQYPVEIYVKIKRDEDSLVLRSGDQRLLVEPGEVSLVNVVMVPLQSVRAPVWEYVLMDIKYLDSDEE